MDLLRSWRKADEMKKANVFVWEGWHCGSSFLSSLIIFGSAAQRDGERRSTSSSIRQVSNSSAFAWPTACSFMMNSCEPNARPLCQRTKSSRPSTSTAAGSISIHAKPGSSKTIILQRHVRPAKFVACAPNNCCSPFRHLGRVDAKYAAAQFANNLSAP